MIVNSAISDSWFKFLKLEFDKNYMQALERFLVSENAQGKTIYPKSNAIFKALELSPLNELKVVVIGQDPYHGPDQAHGLSFSVPFGCPLPPSLKNIFKEIERDLAYPIPQHGCLEGWAKQGVLLLNATLTVEQGKAGSHQGKGWEQFTDRVIGIVNEHCEDVVFLLWGSFAQKKGTIIDQNKHLVLSSSHPSPLSAYRGFLGCNHFSLVNEWLLSKNKQPIDWRL